MLAEKTCRDALLAPALRYGHGQDFRLACSDARQDEAGKGSLQDSLVGDHCPVGEQLLELLLAPAAVERRRM